jgi:hypothetical protein
MGVSLIGQPGDLVYQAVGKRIALTHTMLNEKVWLGRSRLWASV